MVLVARKLVMTMPQQQAPSVRFLYPTAKTSSSTVDLGAIIEATENSAHPSKIKEVSFFVDGRLVKSYSNCPASDSLACTSQPNGMQVRFGSCEATDVKQGYESQPYEALGTLGPGKHVLKAVAIDELGRKGTQNLRVQVHQPPILQTGHSLTDEMHELALAEIGRNVLCDHFVAGHGWGQVWTRDTSYALEQGAAFLHSQISQVSLQKCTEEDPGGAGTVWLQDECGHFGGWPVLSDAIVGARGAWALYKAEGNQTFLQWAYNVTKNSLIRAERDVLDKKSGLFKGCSSFMESNSGYPFEYATNGKMVGKTKALSTNLLYHSGYEIAAEMGSELGIDEKDVKVLQEKASKLREVIRERFWLPYEGFYSYFEDEEGNPIKTMEGLGESIALLDNGFETDPDRVAKIFENTHTTEYGLPSLWPQFDHSANPHNDIAHYYHNGRIWPFVQGYWAMAAARRGNITAFTSALISLEELAEKGRTFAEFYELNSTFPSERRRQLWSDTGYLGMIYQGLFGMIFETGGIRFSPVKPEQQFSSSIALSNFRYREMVLTINIEGSGSKVSKFIVDGIESDKMNTLVPCHLTGNIDVYIEMH